MGATVSARTRDFQCTDTFTLGEETQRAFAAETVRMVRRSQLERAIDVARRAARKRDVHRHADAPTAEREYVRGLEAVLVAAETFLGREEETDDG